MSTLFMQKIKKKIIFIKTTQCLLKVVSIRVSGSD
nr:MAG TPA: hypothetical protein [Caudoviricetes sp.]